MKLLLQRYLAAQFILPLVVSTFFFISFLLTFELFKITEMLVTRDVSLSFVLKLVGNMSLTFMPLALPIAVFFSTIFCMNRLAADSEYIAMRAGGLTKSRIMLPFLMVAGLLTMSVYQLNQNLIPKSNLAFKESLNHLSSTGLLAGIKEGQFFTMIPGLTLFASKSSKYGRNLEDVFLHLKENESIKRIIFAKKGELKFERSNENQTEKLVLILYEGNIVGQAKDNTIEKVLFKKYTLPISQKQFDSQFSIKETMLTSAELEKVLTMTEEEAREAYDFNKKEFFSAKYEFWNRKNGALICFVFCFLGFILGITGNRGKSKNSGFQGLMVLILYYGLYFSLVSVAKKEIIPIPLAVFLPVIVISFLGVWLYSKLDWQS